MRKRVHEREARPSPARRPSARRLLAAILVLAVAGVACGDTKSDTEKAADLLAKGLQAHQEQKLDDAVAAYKRVLELEPSNKFAHYNLGVIEQSQGRPAKAEEHYRAALDIDGAFALALYNLGVLRSEAGATDEAKLLYRKAIDAMPTFAEPNLNLGLLLRDEGNLEEATPYLRKAVELNTSFQSRVGELPPAETTTTAPADEN